MVDFSRFGITKLNTPFLQSLAKPASHLLQARQFYCSVLSRDSPYMSNCVRSSEQYGVRRLHQSFYAEYLCRSVLLCIPLHISNWNKWSSYAKVTGRLFDIDGRPNTLQVQILRYVCQAQFSDVLKDRMLYVIFGIIGLELSWKFWSAPIADHRMVVFPNHRLSLSTIAPQSIYQLYTPRTPTS